MISRSSWKTVLVGTIVAGNAWAASVQPSAEELALDLGSGVMLNLVRIPAGRFIMGSPQDDTSRFGNETPQREVTISRPFYMGVHEVTVAQFERFLLDSGKQHPLLHGAFSRNRGDHPAVSVSWEEAHAFCEWASKKTGRSISLPTEAQWEYACRAGTQYRFGFGDREDELGDYAWCWDNSMAEGETFRSAHPVGSKKPNAWVLYDMHGNVWEWCADWYEPYPEGPATDPTGPETGHSRILRGGSWIFGARQCRSANRNANNPGVRLEDNGFRVVTVEMPEKPAAEKPSMRRLPLAQYRDRMKAGWIGQMVGVGWGAPTEFRHCGNIIPVEDMPRWKPSMVNQFDQDDLYVEMTYLRTLEVYGLDVCIRQAGIDFANSGYMLWHANRRGRIVLRQGIAPADSGHPRFNPHADDIDYQIQADFAGLIAPGLPATVIELGEKFGRLTNYADGVYGGQFVGGMYAEAFFETDPLRIVRAGLACIPAESQYAEAVRDVIDWYHENPDDWKKTWHKVMDKYHWNPAYRRFSCDMEDGCNIDAKINGAFIVMGMLYGQGNLDETIVISTRCGMDSDCNPSNAAGVLFTTVGFVGLPDRFTSALDEVTVFSHTEYNFPKLLEVCEALARQIVIRAGGRIEESDTGEEVFLIPVQAPAPGKALASWEPAPIAQSRFTPQEMSRIGVNP